MASIKARLHLLSAYIDTLRPEVTTFITKSGNEFHTPLPPETYLMQYGAYTPNGQRIALYPHPIVGVDALSLSLYQMIDEAVEVGKLEIPELECDEL